MKVIVELTRKDLEAFANLKFLINESVEDDDVSDILLPANLWVRLDKALSRLLREDV